MANLESPDDRFYDGTFYILEDLDDLNADNLYKSADADKGLIKKLLSMCRFLRNRSCDLLVVRTDGTGGVVIENEPHTGDGSSSLFSSVAISGTGSSSKVRCTFATPFASVYDYAVFPVFDGIGGLVGTSVRTTTYFDLAVRDTVGNANEGLDADVYRIAVQVFARMP